MLPAYPLLARTGMALHSTYRHLLSSEPVNYGLPHHSVIHLGYMVAQVHLDLITGDALYLGLSVGIYQNALLVPANHGCGIEHVGPYRHTVARHHLDSKLRSAFRKHIQLPYPRPRFLECHH
jgi:hypothetical protein